MKGNYHSEGYCLFSWSRASDEALSYPHVFHLGKNQCIRCLTPMTKNNAPHYFHILKLEELIDSCLNGLEWWENEHPEEHSEADEELKRDIRNIIGYKEKENKMGKDSQPITGGSYDLRIEKWEIILYTGSKRSYYRLEGVIYNHPNYPHILNGEPGFTSELMMLDFMNNRAQTKNNLYILGERRKER